MTASPGAAVPHGTRWLLPATPFHVRMAGRSFFWAAQAGVGLWWLSLVMDAMQGRASAWSVCAGLGLVLVWRLLLSRCPPAPWADAAITLHWANSHPVPERPPADARACSEAQAMADGTNATAWRDVEGCPVSVQVVLDTGAGLVIRLQPLPGGASAGHGAAHYRWVGRDALAAGPWRWRLHAPAILAEAGAPAGRLPATVASLPVSTSSVNTLCPSLNRSPSSRPRGSTRRPA